MDNRSCLETEAEEKKETKGNKTIDKRLIKQSKRVNKQNKREEDREQYDDTVAKTFIKRQNFVGKE